MRFKYSWLYYTNFKLRFIYILICSLIVSFKGIVAQDRIPIAKKSNALIKESSAYLLQHAYNPVNWYPWNVEAFDKATSENKLIVLSIGFSSCHWCHVMNEESFENDEVAEFMNANFVSIKVDREEKPDVDQVYMTALQLIKGSGGWPLNMILLPDGSPIYGSTYLPKDEWIKTLSQILKLYKENPEKVKSISAQIVSGVQSNSIIANTNLPGKSYKESLDLAVHKLKTNWDLKNGGEGSEDKFPKPVNLDFLLDYVVSYTDNEAKEFLKLTLNQIANKGLWDHVGGGFFRYSTDSKWQLPHFEKMLYDNAQLISTFSKAYRIFKDSIYKKKVYETFSFLEQQMKNEDGGYAASLNADTNGEEGGSYLWSFDELRKNIPADELIVFSTYYAIDFNDTKGKTLLIPDLDSEAIILKEYKLTTSQFSKLKSKWIQNLRDAFYLKKQPDLDTKVITSWNSLLVTAYIDAYKTFEDNDFLVKAEKLYGYLIKDVTGKKNVEHIVNSNGQSDLYLQDYAYLLRASLNLYEVTLNQQYLNTALELEKEVRIHFLDTSHRFYKYSTNEELLTSIYKLDDGVLPSGNAVMAFSLFNLGTLLSNEKMLNQYILMLEGAQESLIDYPANYGLWNTLTLFNSRPFFEVVVVGLDALPKLRELYSMPITNAFIYASQQESELKLFENRFEENETWIYVCTSYACKIPVNTPEEALDLLKSD
ncbi:thioredoxin domain-containing protein [Leeuwenhoekiella sp. NPDC079379]|uniref:thioredoxin domain-containing protein n=1 Tax=Leeuwenhoekiella sp. NPDC079379 TaxID=3364122 RepID=UPI0037CABDB4